MATRRLITTLSPELKFNRYFFLFDLVVLGGATALVLSTHQFFYYHVFKVIYIALVAITAFWIISRPRHNPFKRNYQVLLMAFRQDNTLYYWEDPSVKAHEEEIEEKPLIDTTIYRKTDD